MGGSRVKPNKRENNQSTPKKKKKKLRDQWKKIKNQASLPWDSCWSIKVKVPLNFLSGPQQPCVGCLLFLLAVSLAFFMHFSSYEPDVNWSETYSSITFQPSALLSAILISFCCLQMSSFPSSVKSSTCLFLELLAEWILSKMLSIWALSSHCFGWPWTSFESLAYPAYISTLAA